LLLRRQQLRSQHLDALAFMAPLRTQRLQIRGQRSQHLQRTAIHEGRAANETMPSVEYRLELQNQTRACRNLIANSRSS
jgi:hypothetical protein